MLLYQAAVLCLLLHVGSGSGPVFVNPLAQTVVQPSQPAQDYVTQTVYGFLDFTTTIGNTVMVFSPQSAAIQAAEKPKEPVVTVIETKPPEPAPVEEQPQIQPSKTQPTTKKPSEEKKKPTPPPQVTFYSKVEVVTQQPKPQLPPSSKVNIVSSVVAPPVISSKVEVFSGPPKVFSKVEVVQAQSTYIPAPVFSSKVEVIGPSYVAPQPVVLSSVVEVQSSDDEPAVAVVGNNLGEPEYDFLSRQPSEVVEETYKVVNLKPSSKFHLKPRSSAAAPKKNEQNHPTGLVTKLGGTVVKDGTTTVHETSVIGTYISGKYAQVLQSTSHIYNPAKPNVKPTPTLRILKTAAPSLGKAQRHVHLEPTPAATNDETALPVEQLFQGGPNLIRPSRRPAVAYKPKFKNRNYQQDLSSEEEEPEKEEPQYKKTPRVRASQTTRSFKTNNHNNKYGRTSTKPVLATVSVFSEPTVTASAARRFTNGRKNKQPRNNNNNNPSNINNTPAQDSGYSRRYKPKIQASQAESSSSSTSLYKFKLNRSPGRWQYKTTPKPRVTIRKTVDDDNDNHPSYQGGNTTPTTPQDYAVPNIGNDINSPLARSDNLEENPLSSENVAPIIDENSTENKVENNPYPLETVKVEISTPADFKDTYYEIATIKSPYTFQVGSVKNTRYITVTSTFEKVIEQTDTQIQPTATEPLTENILATSTNYGKDNNLLDSGIATLPPIYLAPDMETPPLETITETFSTTQTMLKTHILPVIRGVNETSSLTLVQTYHVTRFVEATKTLPPMEAYQFVPSKTLKDLNSHLDEAGSELHLELEFGDDNDEEGENRPSRAFPPELDLANVGSDFDLSEVDKTKLLEAHLRAKKAHPTTPKPLEPVPTPGLSNEQLQQLALLRFLNPQAAQQQVITTSRPVVKLETVYESHVIPIINGANTIFTTISRPLATITKTEYELATSTLPGLPVPPVNPLFQQQQQPQFQITSTPVVTQTMLTQTNSKILKLTFGAKTAYTTIFSTKVIPTLLTTYLTGQVQVQPTAAFPGYFPGYGQFPFVG